MYGPSMERLDAVRNETHKEYFAVCNSSNIKHQTSNIKHQTSNGRHPMIKHQTSNIKHQTSDTKHQTFFFSVLLSDTSQRKKH